MPAISLKALRLKACCVLWSSGDGTVTVCRGNTSDDRFARQIIMSLLEAESARSDARSKTAGLLFQTVSPSLLPTIVSMMAYHPPGL